MGLRRLSIVLVAMLCSGCAGLWLAPPGYYYESRKPGHLFALVSRDPCKAQGMLGANAIRWLNGTKNQPKGVPHTVIGIKHPVSVTRSQFIWAGMRTFFGYPWETASSHTLPMGPYLAPLVCHVTLIFAHHHPESGIVSLVNPGGSSPAHVQWMSDAQFAARVANAKKQVKKQEAAVQAAWTRRATSVCMAPSVLATAKPLMAGLMIKADWASGLTHRQVERILSLSLVPDISGRKIPRASGLPETDCYFMVTLKARGVIPGVMMMRVQIKKSAFGGTYVEVSIP